MLRELLNEYYPAEHQIALYECHTLPIDKARIDWLPLKDFGAALVNQHTTMLVPPSHKMRKNQSVLDRLTELDKQLIKPI